MNKGLERVREYGRMNDDRWIDVPVDDMPLRVHPWLWENYPEQCRVVFRKFMDSVNEKDLKPVHDPFRLNEYCTIDAGIDFIDGHKVVAFLSEFTDTDTREKKKGACLDLWQRCLDLGIVSDANFITTDAPHRHKGRQV